MHSDSEIKSKIALCDLGSSFRGGQRQTLNLAAMLKRKGVSALTLCHADSILSERCREKGIEVYHVKYRSQLLPYDALRIAVYLKKNEYRIFHASDSHSHTLGLLVRYAYHRSRLVVTSRTCLGKPKILSRLFKYGIPGADRFIAISRAVADYLREKGVRPDRIEIIPSSIDRNYFNPEGRPEKSVFTIGTACSLETGKGVDLILTALAGIRDKLGEFKFMVAGSGRQRFEFEQMADNLGLRDRVEFRGFVEDIAEFYRGLDLYILASRSEGLGSSLLEAGACGAALIGSRIGGIGEIIDDGINGFLFERDDRNSLSELVLKVAKNKETREKIVAGIEKKLILFDINTKIKDYLRLYRKVTEGR